MENDNDISQKLEIEYMDNLKSIRPYVMLLTDHEALTCCKVWIEKFEEMKLLDNNGKRIRNDYMTELRRQLQNGNLEEPFCKVAPEGPLQDLYGQKYTSMDLVRFQIVFYVFKYILSFTMHLKNH